MLDEPFSGLDPVNADALRDAVLDLRRNGTTVVLSTHDMTVAERLCDRIFMIFRGRKVLDGSLEDIHTRFAHDTIRVRTSGGAAALAGMAGVELVTDAGNFQDVRLTIDPQEFLRDAHRHDRRAALRAEETVAARHLRGHRPAVGRGHARHDGGGVMTRVFLIARTEFLAIVRGKAFIIGVLMMPVIIALSIAFQVFAERRVDVSERKVVVIDRTGVLYEHLASAAAEHNRDTERDGARTGPAFLLEPVATADATPGETELALSERIRTRDLFAFVEIPASIVDPSLTEQDQVRYYTETPSYTALPQWIRTTLDREAAMRRFAAADVDTALVERLSRSTSLTTLGLLSRAPDGTIAAAQRVSQLQTFALPFGMAYLLFIALMSAVPQLLTAVVEEKMSRISEVLISAVSPSQLMAGKLLGVAAVGTLLALIYVFGRRATWHSAADRSAWCRFRCCSGSSCSCW